MYTIINMEIKTNTTVSLTKEEVEEVLKNHIKNKTSLNPTSVVIMADYSADFHVESIVEGPLIAPKKQNRNMGLMKLLKKFFRKYEDFRADFNQIRDYLKANGYSIEDDVLRNYLCRNGHYSNVIGFEQPVDGIYIKRSGEKMLDRALLGSNGKV